MNTGPLNNHLNLFTAKLGVVLDDIVVIRQNKSMFVLDHTSLSSQQHTLIQSTTIFKTTS